MTRFIQLTKGFYGSYKNPNRNYEKNDLVLEFSELCEHQDTKSIKSQSQDTPEYKFFRKHVYNNKEDSICKTNIEKLHYEEKRY